MITIFKDKKDIPQDMEYIELNVLYFPDKVFCLKECGNNVLEVLYGLEDGYVYSEYALIPFGMDSVVVQTKTGKAVISDYKELKEWWDDEKTASFLFIRE